MTNYFSTILIIGHGANLLEMPQQKKQKQNKKTV